MSLSRKIGAAAGFATPLVAFICIFGAIATYPQFDWIHNALSDLGVVSGVTGILFNVGLVASGGLGFVFAVLGLYAYLGVSRLGKVGAGFFASATVALVLIGVFNEHFSPTHYIVSVAFFSLVPLALFILTCACYLQGKHGVAGFSVAIGLVAAVPWILQLSLEYVPRVAVPEAISAAAVSAWAIVLSAKMLKEKGR